MADFVFDVNVGVTINTPQLTAAVLSGFQEANLVFGRNAQAEITKDKWAWPNPPSPRDIVDNNGLRNSYTPTPIPPDAYDHVWTVDYAMAVHEGVEEKNFPGRPWTKAPLEQLPGDFEKLARQKLAGVT